MIPVLASLIPTIIDKGMELFDKKFETETEKQQAINEFKAKASRQVQDAWNEEQKALTERHKTDMNSDSWLSKNIRPMSMVYLMALFTLAFFYNVPETTLSLLRDLLMTVFVFYFGSRTLEKVTSIIKDKK